jgi:uncharacterized protein
VVDINGDVYPCIYIVGLERFYLGNIADESYPNNDVLDSMMDLLHVDNRDDCRSCTWRYLCSGGCPVGKLIVMDNPRASKTVRKYTKDINCYYTRSVLELLLWEMAEDAKGSVSTDDTTDHESLQDQTMNCK